MPTLPQGISAASFAAALTKFEAALGKQWVFTQDEDVALYRDAYSPLWGEEDERLAAAAVAPDTVEQVQQIVRIANQHKIPLYPISTGKNLGYGGSAPNFSGSVVVDLKRMNRVLEVDDKRHFALVEPSVAYYWCVACHGAGPGQFGMPFLPGTGALMAKYQGTLPAALEQRTDMSPTFIATFVRNGITIMPFFRKTEVSDADLDALIAYLTRNNTK